MDDRFKFAKYRLFGAMGRHSHYGVAVAVAVAVVAVELSWFFWGGTAVSLSLTAILAAYICGIAAWNAKTAKLATQLLETNRRLAEEVTERKRAEATLQASQAKYQAIYDKSSDAIMLLTPEEGFISGNAAAIALYGCEDEADFTAHAPADLSPEYQPDGELSSLKSHRMMAIAMQKGSHFFEWQHLRKDGPGFPATVLLTVMELEGRRVLQATVRDISEQKWVMSELVEARRQAEIANRAKSQFLATMSHEIRTPMTAILGYTDLLASPALTAGNHDAYLAVIRRNGEHLLGLINNILDLSKIEAGKLTLDMAPTDLASLLADVEAAARPRAEQRGITFSVEYDGELPATIFTDNMRLRQAMLNLAGNAVKFTQRGGVRVVAKFLSEACNGQPAVRFQVIDTGIGIRADALPQLFQPFQQADNSIAPRFGGTGLGLAISRHIADLLGGSLTASSVWGRGTTFTLVVPTGSLDGVAMMRSPSQVPQQTACPSSEPAGPILDGVRILLAEDGHDNRELIRTILQHAGAVVEAVENGLEAVEKAKIGTCDIILMDMNMPEMDGYEATRFLRDRGFQKPIVALTANAMSGDSDQCLQAGCNEYLSKPIDRGRLIRTIAALIEKPLIVDQGINEQEAFGETAAEIKMPLAMPTNSGLTVVSQYIDDPEMASILEGFVERLPGQADAMRQAYAAGCYEELQRMAHKLKGAGGSYGYPSLTHACALLESAAKHRNAATAGTALDDISNLVQAIQNGYSPCSATITTG
jgi:PAS domain S-box-containing protein